MFLDIGGAPRFLDLTASEIREIIESYNQSHDPRAKKIIESLQTFADDSK